MKRQLLILVIALAALAGSLVAAWATARARDTDLRGYVDAAQDAALPFRLPRLGVNAELTQYTPSQLEAQLNLMEQARVIWVRQFAHWDEIEATRGTADWTQWDAIVTAFSHHPSLKLVAVLMNTPTWARPANAADQPTAPPADPVDFARFAHDFAARYGATIDDYQLWDEPNLTTSWGRSEPRPADYVALLEAGYAAIHSADGDAAVIAAALAPTTEQGPLNLSDLAYLRDLYALGARASMDAVAAKPYGFSTGPDDRRVGDSVLNFSRIVALRELMVANGDATKPLWASNWGWNSLPASWSGTPSIWGSVTSDEQTRFTLAALDRADREWPWLGGMVLYDWQPVAAADNPVWGFALEDQEGQPTPLLTALVHRPQPDAATNGLYAPANPYTRYSGVWTFGQLGADIGWVGDSQFATSFDGSALSLLLRKGDYVGYLYPTIDGQSANAAPTDADGNAYLILTSPERTPQTALIPVARGLPTGMHTLHVVADRGYDQWALAGIAVSDGDLTAPYNRQIQIALITAVVAAVAVVVSGWMVDWRRLLGPLTGTWGRLGDAAQLAISAVTSVALLVGMVLTWNDAAPNLFRRDSVQLGAAIVSAGLLYLQPGFVLAITAALALFVIFYSRTDLALTLIVFFAPFFLFPVALYKFAFPMTELLVLIATAAWLLRLLAILGRQRQILTGGYRARVVPSLLMRLQPLDYGVIAWLALGCVSILWAERRGTALTELRALIVEPVLFYAMLRTTAWNRRTLIRLVDALLLAGLVVAFVGLWLYFHDQGVITAEAGARRLASVYGSPNNVGLFLGRCIPFALAYLLITVDRPRRIAAAVCLLLFAAAVVFSQSAGALFIGVPVSLVAVLLLVLGRRARLILAGLVVAGIAAFAIALRSARFERLLDFNEGTNFYRIRVWQSAINALRDHPLTGLGLDQFLYAFRSQYIQPDAWQEPNLSHPHNIVLDWWIRLGLVGVAVLLWLQGAFWSAAIRLYRQRSDPYLFALIVGAMGSMIDLLAHGLVDNSVYVLDLVYVFVLLLGIAATLKSWHDGANAAASPRT